MNVFEYILLVFAGLLSIFILGSLLFLSLGWFKFFYHDVLLWHKPAKGEQQTFDGCNVHSICKFCGKPITQDSQGNWFEIDIPKTEKREKENSVFFGKWRLETDEEMSDSMFKLVVCSYCNEKANSTYKFCPHCGKIMYEESE